MERMLLEKTMSNSKVQRSNEIPMTECQSSKFEIKVKAEVEVKV
jgi:hypothetical protein